MIIERQQVITTHNPAVLILRGGVRPTRSWADLAETAGIPAAGGRFPDGASDGPQPLLGWNARPHWTLAREEAPRMSRFRTLISSRVPRRDRLSRDGPGFRAWPISGPGGPARSRTR